MSQINTVMTEVKKPIDETNSDLPTEPVNFNLDTIPYGSRQKMNLNTLAKQTDINQGTQILGTDKKNLSNTISDVSNISNQQNQENVKNKNLNNIFFNKLDQSGHDEKEPIDNNEKEREDGNINSNDNNYNKEKAEKEGVEDEEVKEEEEELEKDNDDGEINIKDFAYSVSDPRHFGIYDDIDDDNDDENYEKEREEYEEEEYNNGYGYSEYGKYSGNEVHNDIEQEEHGFINNQNIIDGRIYSDINETTNNSSYSNEESDDILHAVALYEFTPENSNELPLVPDQLLIINYECGDGWLVAHDPVTGQTGLVPSEYIRILEIDTYEEEHEGTEDPELYNEFAQDAKEAQRFMPEILSVDDNIEYNNGEPRDKELIQNIEKISLT